jgi:hypothetical protein
MDKGACLNSCTLHNTDVSGQLHALAALHPEKSQVSHWTLGWVGPITHKYIAGGGYMCCLCTSVFHLVAQPLH